MAGNNGVIYTKKWVVKLVLDIAGYTSDLPLWKRVVVEPSCGHGSFVREIVERLIESAKRDGKFNANTLQNCVVCYELDENSVTISHSIAKEILILNGMNHEEAEKLSSMWVIHGDYLLADTVPCAISKSDRYTCRSKRKILLSAISNDKGVRYIRRLY